MSYFSKQKTIITLGLLSVFTLTGCMSGGNFKGQLEETLKENPEIITDWIKENPSLFIKTMQEALTNAQQDMKKEREEKEREQFMATMENPLEPKIREDETFRGPSDAPITLVEYSDFECPYCTRGFQTVMELQEKYGDNLRFVFKHLPLSFHNQARIASQYYEAIRLQDEEKAFEFHDEIFKQQKKLSSNGENFLKALAKEVGADMNKLEEDVNSEFVNNRIDEDIAEAQEFGIQGTPGFVINGVPVKGAYPASHFVDIVEELEERGKLSLQSRERLLIHMENQLYTSLRSKVTKKAFGSSDFLNPKSLKDCIADMKKGVDHPSDVIVTSFCHELKLCLDHENLKSCLEHLLNLEILLEELEELYGDDGPHLFEFYRHLSPGLLRVLWESCAEDVDQEELKHRWFEALRVSIEEELYVWQEKITEMN